MDDLPNREALETDFRERLEIDTLAKRYDPEQLRELIDNIVSMYGCKYPYQSVGGQLQSTNAIQQRLDKLTSQHIEYIMDSLSNTTKPVKNIQAYLRATILNAPTTMEHYYQAQSNAAIANRSNSTMPDQFDRIRRRIVKK